MKCPACATQMTASDFGGVTVDVCESGCKGIWFDWMELSKLDADTRGGGQALAEALMSSRNNDAGRGPVGCPKCGIPMHVHKYKRSKAVDIDECYNCGGFFLDSGELSVIRDTRMDDKQIEEYVEQLLTTIPGMTDYRADLERRYVRAKAMMNMTRFIRPSYFVPAILGKEPAERHSIVLPELLEEYRRDPNAPVTPEMRALLKKYEKELQEGKASNTTPRYEPEMRALVEHYGK